jgi:hypothetical protein
MKLPPRYRLVSVAALAVYVVVNIGAAAVHHHHGAAPLTDLRPIGARASDQLQRSEASTDSDQEHCLLCSVLHLAQSLPGVLHVGTAAVIAEQLCSVAPSIRSHPLETTTYSRGPPLL